MYFGNGSGFDRGINFVFIFASTGFAAVCLGVPALIAWLLWLAFSHVSVTIH